MQRILPSPTLPISISPRLKLLRVQLDNELLVNRDLHKLVALNHSGDFRPQVVTIDIHPAGRGCVRGGIAGRENRWIVAAGFAHRYFIADFYLK